MGDGNSNELIRDRLDRFESRFDRFENRIGERLEAMPDRFAVTIGVAVGPVAERMNRIQSQADRNTDRIVRLERFHSWLLGGIGVLGIVQTAVLAIYLSTHN